jgi:hypothetical protein
VIIGCGGNGVPGTLFLKRIVQFGAFKNICLILAMSLSISGNFPRMSSATRYIPWAKQVT